MVTPTNIPPAASSNEAQLTARDTRQHADRVEQQKAKGIQRFFEPNRNVNRSARLFSPHYENPWEGEKQGDNPPPRWMDSMGGRVAIRTFSRGVMGTGLMTWGDHLLGSKSFVPHSALPEGMSRAERMAIFDSKYGYYANETMNGIAKFYDVTFGNAIKSVFGKEAVTFRNLRNFRTYAGAEGVHMGRSYGEEAVAITLSFALGGIGDAWGRNIAGIFDPNVKKSWIHDGHINFGEFAKATAKSAWRVVSYNQMEDWVAAVPYVYAMRGLRHGLDKQWSGSRLMLEHSMNGGAYQVDAKGKITGDYTLPGGIDLGARFVLYNMPTLMFRDAYNHFTHSLSHRHDPEKSKPERGLTEEAMKYVLKSGIKATMYMTPAVMFFWPQRVAHFMSDENRIQPAMDGKAAQIISQGAAAADGRIAAVAGETGLARILRPMGNVSRRLGTNLGIGVANIAGLEGEARVSAIKHGKAAVGNAWAYAPYMMMKYETANVMDTPQMDAAAYSVVDGVDHLNWKEVKRGFGDIVNVVRRLPVSEATELKAHEARGLINSTQQGLDSDNIRDGHLAKSFADKQREHKIARQKDSVERGVATVSFHPEIANTNHPAAANSNDRPGSRISASQSLGALALTPQHAPAALS